MYIVFQFPNQVQREYGQDIFTISSESEAEGDDEQTDMDSTLSASEYQTINNLPDPDETPRTVGFNKM